MIAQKKKVMMQQAAPAPSGTPITGLTWALNHQIMATGEAVIGSSTRYVAAAGDATTVSGRPSVGTITPQSRTIKFTGSGTYGSYTLNCYVHEYKADTWQRRLRLEAGQTVSLASDTEKIAFTCAFGASTGQNMTLAVIAASFAAEWMD